MAVWLICRWMLATMAAKLLIAATSAATSATSAVISASSNRAIMVVHSAANAQDVGQWRLTSFLCLVQSGRSCARIAQERDEPEPGHAIAERHGNLLAVGARRSARAIRDEPSSAGSSCAPGAPGGRVRRV